LESARPQQSKQSSSPSGAALVERQQVLADRLTTADPDVLREVLSMFIHTLMGAEADALCGADYGERSTDRTNRRNGYWRRQFDTRTGTLDLPIPKAAAGLLLPGLDAGEAVG
jgi:putative transposase